MTKLDLNQFIRELEETATADMPVKSPYNFLQAFKSFVNPEQQPLEFYKQFKFKIPLSKEQIIAIDNAYRESRSADKEIKYGLHPGFLWGIIAVESKGSNSAVSHAGAKGYFGIMPAEKSGFWLDKEKTKRGNPLNPIEAAEYAAKTFSYLIKKYHNNIKKAIVAYNWGMGKFAQIGNDLNRIPGQSRAYTDIFDPFITASTVTPKDSPVPILPGQSFNVVRQASYTPYNIDKSMKKTGYLQRT